MTQRVADVLKVGDEYFDEKSIKTLLKKIEILTKERDKAMRDSNLNRSTAQHNMTKANAFDRLVDNLMEVLEERLDNRYKWRDD